jgi:hypothetical protein
MSDYYASYNDPVAAKQIAETYGFCLVKGVFSPAEMDALERDLAMAHAEFHGNVPDLYSIPSLQWLLFDERIRGLAHELLGQTLVYYRETSAAYEKVPGALTAKPFNDFHCDARGTSEKLHGLPESQGIYPGYRFGIYFRNYRNYSGGLKVAPASHLRSYIFDRRYNVEKYVRELPSVTQRIGPYDAQLRLQPMELYNVPSEPGDIVIFSLRVCHSAGAVRLKYRPNLALLPIVDADLPPDIRLPIPPGSRNAIFLDYGAPQAALDYYIKWRAVVKPALLDAHYKYDVAPPDWMVMRNDKIIVALAQRLVEGGSSAAKDAADLVALCASHVEFSPYHALFDRAAFDANVARTAPALAMDLAHDITARVRAHDEVEAQDRALAKN